MSERKISVIILAAGLGKRMKSSFPKVLHPVCGQPMIDHVIESLLPINPERSYLVIGHLAEMVEKHITTQFNKESLEFVIQMPQLGTGHAVMQTKKFLQNFDGDVIVCCGDAPLMRTETFNSLIQHKRKNACAGVVLSAILPDPTGYGRIIRNPDGSLSKIVEQKDCTPEESTVKEVSTGTYCFESKLLFKYIDQISNNNAQGEYYLTDVVELLLADQFKFMVDVLSDPDEMIGINSRRHLAMANAILRERILGDLMDSGVTLVDPKLLYVEKKVKAGKDTIIYPFVSLRGKTTIGERCKIASFTDALDLTLPDDSSYPPFSAK